MPVDHIDVAYKDEEDPGTEEGDGMTKKSSSIVGIDLWGRRKRGQKRLDFKYF